jgi:hypothetical protein
MVLGDGLSARNLLDRYPQDRSCCWMFSRALIEYISYTLGESGSSSDQCNDALLLGEHSFVLFHANISCDDFRFFANIAHKANPYAIFTLVYSESFSDAIQLVDKIHRPPAEGSVEEALIFHDGSCFS